jgi:hypothetical protein
MRGFVHASSNVGVITDLRDRHCAKQNVKGHTPEASFHATEYTHCTEGSSGHQSTPTTPHHAIMPWAGRRDKGRHAAVASIHMPQQHGYTIFGS